MSGAEEEAAGLMDKVEKLYSLVNRIRFYRDVMLDAEVEKLSKEAEQLRKEINLTPEEVEKLADELDEYYISGASPHGDTDPLTYWTLCVKERSSKR
ncbi:MAG: hypothetical protein RMI43_04750 [Candidatus Caldarchaeum sp.]|nr:hypothetical protein [Candidatus Caldarchaeum sp.]MDW8063459.1 hypothetical protein [Candidatus Caldarchaeum sp.]MDW8434976.1 hypothetical protein [Candidatus Caldarchaeum sp.]